MTKTTAPPATDNTAQPEEWYQQQFNHFSAELANNLEPTLAAMREQCPVAHSKEFDGFFIATRYKDIQRIAQDWQTFSSEQGMVVPYMPDMIEIPVIPEALDPPQHGYFKEVISRHLTPAAVAQHEAATRDIIHGYIDQFIDRGHCEFMAEFADPMPGSVLFEHYLNAPREDLAKLIELASKASVPMTEGSFAARDEILKWVRQFVKMRAQQPRRDDLVDGIMYADINGRPITEIEVLGVIQLIIFGGLDTTAGALGHMMVRFCRQPEIPRRLREQPELIPAAVEELLRLGSPFACIARTATKDTQIGDKQIKQGERVLMYWQSANHDEAVFSDAQQFDPERSNLKRHMAFGTGTHRCAGANLALLNLRLAVEAIVSRLHNLRFADAEPIHYHPGFARAPKRVAIQFETKP